MSHSPAPWIWVDGPQLNGLLVSDPYQSGDPFILALDELGDSEHAEADQALIAAAPDLLAACKEALLLCEMNNYGKYGRTPVQKRLRDAIAKAEGRS